jgi:hypothetical protein
MQKCEGEMEFFGQKYLNVPTTIDEAIQIYNEFGLKVFKTPYDIILFNAKRLIELNNEVYMAE